MRVIKFRCYVRETKDMCYSDRLLGIESNFKTDNEEHCIMQYTETTDKNGSEIYEGDIIKDKFNESYEVIWYSKHARFSLYSNTTGYSSLIQSEIKNSESIIIGNIYENPELLKNAN